MFATQFRNRFWQGRGGGQGAGQGRGGGSGQGQGRGAGNKPGSGPAGDCVCPKCGKHVPHVAGQRCVDQVCPDCGTKMIRE
jgi:hypothetical protein